MLLFLKVVLRVLVLFGWLIEMTGYVGMRAKIQKERVKSLEVLEFAGCWMEIRFPAISKMIWLEFEHPCVRLHFKYVKVWLKNVLVRMNRTKLVIILV